MGQLCVAKCSGTMWEGLSGQYKVRNIKQHAIILGATKMVKKSNLQFISLVFLSLYLVFLSFICFIMLHLFLQ